MPMMNDDEELPDWEVKDEEPPERLQKKWEQEEARGPRTVVCPSCKKETSAENIACIFCGAEIFEEISLSRCFFAWVKHLFKKG
jgi:hypothetical protein